MQFSPPVELETGQYLELRGPDDRKSEVPVHSGLHSPRGEVLREIRPEGEIPMLEPGANAIAFHCVESACRPRVYVTVITEG